MEKADLTKKLLKRQYGDVPSRLRKIFGVPDDEMILDFEWNRNIFIQEKLTGGF